ncbi:hypothetical protein AFL01nite_25500 [Aeromicrobium flavum]|uniref:Uncharacterized protein n=1 Tax=Aeromicrobium flavum TaxID=416568 RepID=A0A512HXP6_9ACTN|nr:hypothetical protein AFL01nite_25500 [Aeromicrobium flavum]
MAEAATGVLTAVETLPRSAATASLAWADTGAASDRVMAAAAATATLVRVRFISLPEWAMDSADSLA